MSHASVPSPEGATPGPEPGAAPTSEPSARRPSPNAKPGVLRLPRIPLPPGALDRVAPTVEAMRMAVRAASLENASPAAASPPRIDSGFVGVLREARHSVAAALGQEPGNGAAVQPSSVPPSPAPLKSQRNGDPCSVSAAGRGAGGEPSVAHVAPPPGEEPPPALWNGPAGRTRRPVVYLADPDAMYRTVLADALRLRAMDVVEFSNGYDLCSACLPAPPDLVVMETGLEELSGFAVFTRLHRQLGSGRFRAVFLTAFDNPGVARVCKSRGVLEYLGKQHVTLQQMASTIEGLLPADSGRETFRFGREAEAGAAALTVLGPRIEEDPSVQSQEVGDEAGTAAGVEDGPPAGGWISGKLRTLVGQGPRKGRAPGSGSHPTLRERAGERDPGR